MHELNPKYSAYYKRAAVVIKLVRFAVLLSFVVFSVFCIGFFKDNITIDNLRYLFKYIDLSGSDNTPSDASITISTRPESNFHMLHNDLAAVSNSGIALYDFAGRKLYSYDYSYSNAASVSNGKSILVYDTGGKQMAIYSSVSKVLEKTLDYNIKSACINDLGYFAVVNSEKTYRSGVIVFKPDPKPNEKDEIFRWMSPDKYVTSVALNSNASLVACTAVYNKNGSFVSEIMVYNTSTGEKTYSAELNDALALKIGYADNDSKLYVLTDSSFAVYKNNLELVDIKPYNQSNAKFFREFDDCFIIAESNNLAGNSMTVKAYDYDASLLFEQKADSKITDVQYTDSTLYLLMSDGLAVYDYNAENGELSELAVLPLNMQYKAVRTDDYGRYILIGAKSADRNSLAALLEGELADN